MTIYIEFVKNGVKTVITVEKASSLFKSDYFRLDELGIKGLKK